jgi:leader peptidase (prepilin peptidase)/N-methyltransferase
MNSASVMMLSRARVRDGEKRRLMRRPLLVLPFVVTVVALAFAEMPADRAVVAAITGAALVVLSAIDIQQRILPNRIVLPAAALVLVLQLALFSGQAGEWLLAPLIAALVFVIPTLFGRAWMGMGDVKLMLLLGVALGWGVLGAALLAFVLVLPVSLVLFVRQGMAARKATIPFGPFLAAGGLIVLIGPYIAGFVSS